MGVISLSDLCVRRSGKAINKQKRASSGAEHIIKIKGLRVTVIFCIHTLR